MKESVKQLISKYRTQLDHIERQLLSVVDKIHSEKLDSLNDKLSRLQKGLLEFRAGSTEWECVAQQINVTQWEIKEELFRLYKQL